MGNYLDLTVTTRFVTQDCIECGVLFAITQTLYEERLQDHKGFSCPNGHSQHFTAKSDAQKAKEASARAHRAERDAAAALARARAAEDQLAAANREAKRVKRRVTNGVCPCCNRTFKQLAAHMKRMHPNDVT